MPKTIKYCNRRQIVAKQMSVLKTHTEVAHPPKVIKLGAALLSSTSQFYWQPSWMPAAECCHHLSCFMECNILLEVADLGCFCKRLVE